MQDRDGARLVFARVQGWFSRLRLVWADGGYAGAKLANWVWELREGRRIRLELVERNPAVKGFVVLPRRWVVERTFGWLGRHRRLSKDYEYLPESSETLIYIAMMGLMLRRLAAE